MKNNDRFSLIKSFMKTQWFWFPENLSFWSTFSVFVTIVMFTNFNNQTDDPNNILANWASCHLSSPVLQTCTWPDSANKYITTKILASNYQINNLKQVNSFHQLYTPMMNSIVWALSLSTIYNSPGVNLFKVHYMHEKTWRPLLNF